ncbi:hypothetical protein [Oenococcus sp.]|uniref:sunset domain-containing protein n=1 Tax=Oenococcus sp. TaxID=1979414 RepID=UPI0039E75DA4
MKRNIVRNFLLALATLLLFLGLGFFNNDQSNNDTVFAKAQVVKGIQLHIAGKHSRKVTFVTNAAGKVTISGRVRGDKKVSFKQYKGGFRAYTVKANKKGHFKKTIKVQKGINKVAYTVDSHKVSQLVKKHSKKYVSQTVFHITIKRSAASKASQRAAAEAASSSEAASLASSKASSEAAESSSKAAAASSSRAAAIASSQAAASAAASSRAAAQAASQRAASQAAAKRNAQANQAAANNTGEQQYVDANGNGLIKGSVDHIYHIPGSTYYDRTKHVVQWFKTVSDAVRAGYRAPLR